MELHKTLPSTEPGKSWKVHTSKNRAGFVTGCATEGTAGESNGFVTFTYTMFQARQIEVATTAKRATAKAEFQALRDVVAKLVADGLVMHDAGAIAEAMEKAA